MLDQQIAQSAEQEGAAPIVANAQVAERKRRLPGCRVNSVVGWARGIVRPVSNELGVLDRDMIAGNGSAFSCRGWIHDEAIAVRPRGPLLAVYQPVVGGHGDATPRRAAITVRIDPPHIRPVIGACGLPNDDQVRPVHRGIKPVCPVIPIGHIVSAAPQERAGQVAIRIHPVHPTCRPSRA